MSDVLHELRFLPDHQNFICFFLDSFGTLSTCSTGKSWLHNLRPAAQAEADVETLPNLSCPESAYRQLLTAICTTHCIKRRL